MAGNKEGPGLLASWPGPVDLEAPWLRSLEGPSSGISVPGGLGWNWEDSWACSRKERAAGA